MGIIKGFVNLVLEKNIEVGTKRMSICITCDKHLKNWCLKQRGGCGCYLPAKVVELGEECPDLLWKKEE